MKRAFTLLEVLIAIALSLVLGAAMFVFLHDMLATRSRTLEHAMRQRAAATLIERVEADLATCLVGDAKNGAGVQGDATHLRILTRGVMPQLASRGLDDPAALADLHAVEYRFDAGGRRVEARKGLVDESSDFTTLGGEVAHVRFRYLDGRQWRESCDSLASNHLPGAIEVCVWFGPWPGDAEQAAATAQEGEGETPASRPVDSSGNFDEQAYAAASDAELFRPPPPDRRRVIVIPDAGDTEVSDAEQ